MLSLDPLRDVACVACGSLIGRIFTSPDGPRTALTGESVRLPDRDGLAVYGSPRRTRIGKGSRHPTRRGLSVDLAVPAHGRSVVERDFLTYCPNCGQRMRVTV